MPKRLAPKVGSTSTQPYITPVYTQSTQCHVFGVGSQNLGLPCSADVQEGWKSVCEAAFSLHSHLPTCHRERDVDPTAVPSSLDGARVGVSSGGAGGSSSSAWHAVARHPHHLAIGKQPKHNDLRKKRPKSGWQRSWPNAEVEVTLMASAFPNPSAPAPAPLPAPTPS